MPLAWAVLQNGSGVGLSYDTVGRRTPSTLPNGIVTTSTYDAASQLTGLTYHDVLIVIAGLALEQDRASALLIHQPQLAGPTAGEFRNRR